MQRPFSQACLLLHHTFSLKSFKSQTRQLQLLRSYHRLLNSGVKPGRQEMVITYIVDSATGKATMTTKISAYEVDPDSLQARFVGTHEPGLEQQVRCDAR